jgi:hypothetical protein
MSQLIAFHGDPAIKAQYLARVQAHAAADEIIHGTYWENGKGCAVGCTVHSSSHQAFETELGIPCMLARLEDCLFEGQRNGTAKTFPARFLAAPVPGADLSPVAWQFLHWLLTEELAGRDDPRVARQIKACADVLVPLTKGLPTDRQHAIEAAREARNAAYAATATADAAAYAAADAAAYAAAYAATATAAAYAASAAYATASAAAAAATAAAYAADATASAAYATASAAAAAYAAAAEAATALAARSKCYERMANKLVELMAAAPMAEVAA